MKGVRRVIVSRSLEEARRIVAAWRERGLLVGFVPTMGYLHEGHLALLRMARRECDRVAASIFVNPLQFGPGEDYLRYPRDEERDLGLAREAGVDLVFLPPAEEMYPPGFSTYIEVEGLSAPLCGRFRPGHFRGVATVVAKLFLLFLPQRAYFGEKDAQQLLIVRRLVRDLGLPVEVVGHPTVREPDGLALSSRNSYLSPREREAALCLWRALQAGRKLLEQGERRVSEIAQAMEKVIRAEPLARLEYAECVTLPGLEVPERAEGRILLAVAARVGPARLIDNLPLEVTPEGVATASV